MSFSNYLEEKLLDHTFRGIAYSAPATVYLALFTSAPGEAGGGIEVSGGSYVRQAITLTRAGSVLSNSGVINFPGATANWGELVSGAVFDAVSGGNMLAKGPLSASRLVLDGDIVSVPIGQFTITLD